MGRHPAGAREPRGTGPGAARGRLDRCRRGGDDPQGARRVNVGGTRNVVALGAPVVYFSTDYVFDGTQGGARTSSRTRRTRCRPTAGRSCTARREAGEGWIVRTSWLFGPTGQELRPHDAAAGRERDEVRVVDDQRGSPTYVGHLAEATEGLVEPRPRGLAPGGRGRLHLGRVRGGDLRGGRRALPRRRRSRRPSSAAPRAAPAYSVAPQRSRDGPPTLPALARRPTRVPRGHGLRTATTLGAMSVLVTGGAGFIGSHFVKRLAARATTSSSSTS